MMIKLNYEYKKMDNCILKENQKVQSSPPTKKKKKRK